MPGAIIATEPVGWTWDKPEVVQARFTTRAHVMAKARPVLGWTLGQTNRPDRRRRSMPGADMATEPVGWTWDKRIDRTPLCAWCHYSSRTGWMEGIRTNEDRQNCALCLVPL
ncbi:hypothetical protein AVEN_201771-1 [Araneus ventricosus]|uniref:Uncharacterized protein n=1 Tax=Araneus ventricosus TaxID=182803 RepID=A0A4Y2L079_ARAVE|nr:hypothetical protein AVEN_201771-1 [Araneus ventricosus]